MQEPRLTFREYQQLESEFRKKKELKIKNPKAKRIKIKKSTPSKKSLPAKHRVALAFKKLGY